MNVSPTLEGGLRIDMETAEEWELLRHIGMDARARATDLADAMGGLIEDESGGGDWREYVVPDLREAFADEIDEVGAAIEAAAHHANQGSGSLWITNANAYHWYSSLNQARLALEELYHFGPKEPTAASIQTEDTYNAFMRGEIYRSIQQMLLEYAMK